MTRLHVPKSIGWMDETVSFQPDVLGKCKQIMRFCTDSTVAIGLFRNELFFLP